MTGKTRFDPTIFELPVEQMVAGHFSDKYFVRARDVLLADSHAPNVVMQIFCRTTAFLAGMDEAIAILKLCSTDWDLLKVHALYDGDSIDPRETVMTVEGPYHLFAHLETLYLGVLSRRTRVATNTRRVVDAARPKEVMFFPARHDLWSVQAGDGYAAHIAGATSVSTDAQASMWDNKGVGTVPHALIAAYGGDTVLATRKLAEHTSSEVRLVTLVDFDNNCVDTSVAVARELGDRLYGVRLDTSATLVDKSLISAAGDFDLELHGGVCEQLVFNVRRALDAAGYPNVKIIVSGGMTVQKIQRFETRGVPCDGYGVGSSLLSGQGNFDFTADIVMVNGVKCAKVGREYSPNESLQLVD
ncbi:MAG: quinolinate phosphoribosyl transferase [Gammaproteobacteria bacterium]|nr:quinolinate phosphoribosyl transferase [Gammaproteobacteria bacterium]